MENYNVGEVKLTFPALFFAKNQVYFFTEKGKSYAKQTAAKLVEAEYNAFCDWSEEEINDYLRLVEKHNISLRKEIQSL